MERGDRSPPREQDTARAADLPVEGLPPDAPDVPGAAVDAASGQPDPARTAHDPGAARGPRAVMAAYTAALVHADAAEAADLYAENALLTSADRRVHGRAGIAGWHRELFAAGAVAARASGQGNDAGRLEAEVAGRPLTVELSFDASGRIGTARWLDPDEAARAQEERERTAT